MKKITIKQSFKRTIIAATLMSAFTSLSVQANDTMGHIAGQTIAYSGDNVGTVEITIVNMNTGLTRDVTSDEEGNFRFPLLPPGKYIMYAQKDGFEVTEQQNINVTIGGKTLIDVAMNEEGMETIEVRASSIAAIDTTQTESGIVITAEELGRIPVPIDMNAIALLAPGTSKGDSGFGNLVSFGGSSVAENSYYINGLNVTNVRNGLGFSKVPRSMYETFKIKTGGYSAEFGRSTGGVIAATTKSGSNDFKAGADVLYQPDSLRENRPDVLRSEEGAELYGSEYYIINHGVTRDRTEVSAWASGALIEDKLFFFGIYAPIFTTNEYAGVRTHTETDSDDAFWGAKIDWDITSEHRLELTYFSDERTFEVNRRPYDLENKVIGQYYGDGRVVHPVQGTYEGIYEQQTGGTNYALKYTGLLTDDLTVSAMVGHNEHLSNWNPVTNNGQSPIGDRYTGITIAGPIIGSSGVQEDTRDQYRIDFDYFWGDHSLRFGVDYESLEAIDFTQNSGEGSFNYDVCRDNLYDYLEGGEITCLNDDRMIQSYYFNQGSFESESIAFYIQDEWQFNDEVTIQMGLRSDSFENRNADGDAYVEMSDQIAPRLGVSWDIGGNGDTKLSASYGRFYLPIATNTNIRLAGSEENWTKYYYVDGIDNDTMQPINPEMYNEVIFADGQLKDTRELIDSSIEPMFQDEYMLAFEQSLGDFAFGFRGTYRKLGETIEDVAVDKGFKDYLAEQGIDCTECTGFNYYVLTNPGSDLTFHADPDGEDGSASFQKWNIPSEYLGYPEAERKHLRWDVTIDRRWQKDWSMSLTYTWAHTWGNTEGSVNSDIEQTDSGITQSFDQPGLMDYANGNLPSDHRHTIKLNGAYAITDELTVGFNANWQTGRPNNCLGYHPTDEYASQYGAFAFYCSEVDPESEDMDDPDYISVPSPRGTRGETPNTFIVDLNLNYNTQLWGMDTSASVRVFNIFNEIETTQYNEIGEIFDGFEGARLTGKPNPDYGLVNSTTTPRYVQFLFSVKY